MTNTDAPVQVTQADEKYFNTPPHMDAEFVAAWCDMEKTGYLYSEENVAKVHLGWLMARRHRAASNREGARDEIRDALIRAYSQGANDVHAEWQKHWESGDGYGPPDPDFTEAAHDHAASEMPGLGAALASLSTPATPMVEEGLRDAASRALTILERNLHRQNEKCDDAVNILRRALSAAPAQEGESDA